MNWFKKILLNYNKPEVNALSWKMGHRIVSYVGNEEWFYADTGESALYSRACIKCNKHETKDGHDPCIANLSGVQFACCGHGTTKGYLHFLDGETKYFEPNQEKELVIYSENKLNRR